MSKKSFIVTIDYSGDLEPEYETHVADNIAGACWHELETAGLTPEESSVYGAVEGLVVVPDTRLVELIKAISGNITADIFFDADEWNEPGLKAEIDALFENVNALRKLFNLNPIE